MPIKDLITVWNDQKLIKKNIDFLRIPTKDVKFPITNITKHIIENLIDTYQSVPCAGIAANQIGYNKKIFIGMKHDKEPSVQEDSTQNIDDVIPNSQNYEIYINPQIEKTYPNSTQIGSEGCLSIPEIELKIERFDNIKIKYYNVEGKAIKKPLSGFLSRLYQHELLHLEGKLMIEDAMNNIQILDLTNEKYSKLIIQLNEYINN